MSNSTIKQAWACGSCEEVHDSEYAAEECCRPEPYRVWICPACTKAHDSEQDASACCPVVNITCPNCLRDYSGEAMQVAAIEVAGHCSTCRPAYSYAEQRAIEDLVLTRTGTPCQSIHA